MGGLSKYLVIYFADTRHPCATPPASAERTMLGKVTGGGGGGSGDGGSGGSGGGGYMIANNGRVFFVGTRLKRENSAYGPVPARDFARRMQ